MNLEKWKNIYAKCTKKENRKKTKIRNLFRLQSKCDICVFLSLIVIKWKFNCFCRIELKKNKNINPTTMIMNIE